MTAGPTAKALTGVLLDERTELTFEEVCRVSGIRSTVIVKMVTEGLLEPVGNSPEHWRFPGHSLARLRRAQRLQADLDINLPGVALALDLLDELQTLRCRVASLETLLAAEVVDKSKR